MVCYILDRYFAIDPNPNPNPATSDDAGRIIRNKSPLCAAEASGRWRLSSGVLWALSAAAFGSLRFV